MAAFLYYSTYLIDLEARDNHLSKWYGIGVYKDINQVLENNFPSHRDKTIFENLQDIALKTCIRANKTRKEKRTSGKALKRMYPEDCVKSFKMMMIKLYNYIVTTTTSTATFNTVFYSLENEWKQVKMTCLIDIMAKIKSADIKNMLPIVFGYLLFIMHVSIGPRAVDLILARASKEQKETDKMLFSSLIPSNLLEDHLSILPLAKIVDSYLLPVNAEIVQRLLNMPFFAREAWF